MAPPNFPNGMSLDVIGFAALKYPALPPPPFNVPLGNIVGALQHQPPAAQSHQVAQIASRYLDSLIEYQLSDDPSLHDPSLPQYYFSSALCLMNFMNMNPDVCKRIVAKPAIVNDLIEKLLADDFVDRMKSVPRPGGPHFPAATFEDDFGSVLQFLSTMLLYKAEMETIHPRIQELVPKCRTWKNTYKRSRVKTIGSASERLVDQIQGMEPMMVSMMRDMQEQSLVCGVMSCKVRGPEGLTLCGTCRIQRYCGKDHQKADWKYHKHICSKGLDESAVTPSE
jgi:hypothetical protein